MPEALQQAAKTSGSRKMSTRTIITGIAALFLATGTAHAADAINVCHKRFQARELQPGDEIGACFAKATNNTCDGLDGSNAQVCLDWVESRWRVMRVLGGQLLTPVRARRLSMTTLLRPVHRDVFCGRFDIECSCE